MNSIFTPALRKQQLDYLGRKNGLSELFEKIQLTPIFKIPQNSIVINLDNITFGPHRFTVTLPLCDQFYHKIIYYCILYYIFERNNKEKGEVVYQQLISYILNSDIHFRGSTMQLSELEIRIYLVKFMNLLWGSRFKNKVVVDELSTIPPMDILLTQLISQIMDEQQFVIEKNARKIESEIKYHLGFSIELLSYELFLIEGEYMVEIRQFDTSCEFVIIHQSKDKIDQIRNQFYMGESAFFRNQSDGLCGCMQTTMRKRNNCKITKKDTIRSIQLQLQLDMQESHHFNDLLDFGSAKDMNQLMINKSCNLAESVQIQTDVKQQQNKELSMTKDYTCHSKQQTCHSKQQTCHSKQQTCHSKQSCEQKQIRHRLTFNQIVNSSNIGKQSNLNIQQPSMTSKTSIFNSISTHSLHRIGLHNNRMILHKNKTLTNICASASSIKLNASCSSTNYKSQSPGLVSNPTIQKNPQQRSKRVPSFVLMRQKAKIQASAKTNTANQQNTTLSKTTPSILPKIHFLYSTNK